MKEIVYFDRVERTLKKEKVYGGFFLSLLYGPEWWSRWISWLFLPVVARTPFLSRFYGWMQKSILSRYKIKPFIKAFGVDKKEFLDSVDTFSSFNDFFIRRLNLDHRPLAPGKKVAILPADARYLAFSHIEQTASFWVKGQRLSLPVLLGDAALAQRYEKGTLVVARLCPVDYHRFHFPCEGTPALARAIPGSLFSVNPLALRKNLQILTENKRVITPFHTEAFGTLLIVEIGATHVGTIHQTYTPGLSYAKGDEKGYFSFGGSCLILLFEPGRIQIESDLLTYSAHGIEVRGLLGQPLGVATYTKHQK